MSHRFKRRSACVADICSGVTERTTCHEQREDPKSQRDNELCGGSNGERRDRKAECEREGHGSRNRVRGSAPLGSHGSPRMPVGFVTCAPFGFALLGSDQVLPMLTAYALPWVVTPGQTLGHPAATPRLELCEQRRDTARTLLGVGSEHVLEHPNQRRFHKTTQRRADVDGQATVRQILRLTSREHGHGGRSNGIDVGGGERPALKLLGRHVAEGPNDRRTPPRPQFVANSAEVDESK